MTVDLRRQNRLPLVSLAFVVFACLGRSQLLRLELRRF
jgi:hypothetical protein